MRLHGTEAWRRRAKRQLLEHPLCAICIQQARVTVATVADHIVPHHGDPNLFILGKLQSLCGHCHNSRKQSIERRGYDIAVGVDGFPIDRRHPCYRSR